MIQELDVQKIRKDFPMLQNQNLIYLLHSAQSHRVHAADLHYSFHKNL